MRTLALLIVFLGLCALAFAPGIASAADQGAGVLASSAAERAVAVSGAFINGGERRFHQRHPGVA